MRWRVLGLWKGVRTVGEGGGGWGITESLPEGGADGVAALAGLDGDDFSWHEGWWCAGGEVCV